MCERVSQWVAVRVYVAVQDRDHRHPCLRRRARRPWEWRQSPGVRSSSRWQGMWSTPDNMSKYLLSVLLVASSLRHIHMYIHINCKALEVVDGEKFDAHLVICHSIWCTPSNMSQYLRWVLRIASNILWYVYIDIYINSQGLEQY